MNKEIIFYIVTAGYYILPIFLTYFIILVIKHPRSQFIKTAIAILVPWASLVIFTAYVLNPAGIAYATAQGLDNPSMRFDNNTVSVALLSGWLPQL